MDDQDPNKQNKIGDDQQGIPTSVGIQKERDATGVSEAFISPSEVEPKISQEVAEFGIKKVSEPVLSDEALKSGASFAKESTPVPPQPSGIIQLPTSEKDIKKEMKRTRVRDSWRWFLSLLKIKVDKDKLEQKEMKDQKLTRELSY